MLIKKDVDLINSGIEPFPGENFLASSCRSEAFGHLGSATTDTKHVIVKPMLLVIVVPLFR
jgi:hypothetical protein